jgi:nucleoside 2-deoxyribosyltransferase
MKTNLEREIFLICPVRGADEEKEKIIRDLICRMESIFGEKVYYPKDHTTQNDLIGLNICSQNRTAIKKSKEVMIYYDPKSSGTRFDVGMSFMANKPLYVANSDDFPNEPHELNEFESFLLDYTLQGLFKELNHTPSEVYSEMVKQRKEIKHAQHIEYEWRENDGKFLFDFGMAFMAEKPIILLNREEVEKKRTPHKSFQNVLLALDDMYRQK